MNEPLDLPVHRIHPAPHLIARPILEAFDCRLHFDHEKIAQYLGLSALEKEWLIRCAAMFELRFQRWFGGYTHVSAVRVSAGGRDEREFHSYDETMGLSVSYPLHDRSLLDLGVDWREIRVGVMAGRFGWKDDFYRLSPNSEFMLVKIPVPALWNDTALAPYKQAPHCLWDVKHGFPPRMYRDIGDRGIEWELIAYPWLGPLVAGTIKRIKQASSTRTFLELELWQDEIETFKVGHVTAPEPWMTIDIEIYAGFDESGRVKSVWPRQAIDKECHPDRVRE